MFGIYKMVYKDPANAKLYKAKRAQDLKKHAIDSIISGEIIDQYEWDIWCNEIKRGANKKNKTYSENFTNEIMFTMMVIGCFYCGDIATTIDRIDSNIGHTTENCIGCCEGCNYSKGAADSATFIRKAYYRARGKYVDDITNVWFENKQKPNFWTYKHHAKKRGISFELTNEVWNMMIKRSCEYCKRTPVTWVGIDRIIPEYGYVLDNVVSCCYDCNLDKHVADVDATMKRNERIANRVDTGVVVINVCPKVILHNGSRKTSRKVCAYGKIYASKIEASIALGKADNYVCVCIKLGRHSRDIFEIDDDSYFDVSLPLDVQSLIIRKHSLSIRKYHHIDKIVF